MKLVIFGSTGSIGRHLVSQAVERGHSVTAFVRDPSRLERQDVRVVRGDVLDPATVEPAVRGQDAVLCSLGAGRAGAVRAAGTAGIVRAMEQAGVRRLICQSTLGVGESRDNLSFFWKHIMFGLLLRKAFRDHVEQERIVRHSGLDWVIVRPGAFTDGDLTGTYRHGFPPGARNLSLKISRADVAHFMLEQLEDETYLRQAPGLCY